MLGVPASHGALGWAAIALGLLLAAAVVWALRGRAVPAGIACLAVAALALPYGVWRIGEDLRLTTTLHGYDSAAAGPVQAFLPGYLLDPVPRLIPPGATYATLVGAGVPFPTARAAFPALALQTLFPRVSEPVGRADYIVGWGVSPAAVAQAAHGGRVVVARKAFYRNPPVLVAKVRK